jgi:hypothetical protein
MNRQPDNDAELVSRLEEIVNRMQVIQRAIKSLGAPPSMLEIGELKELGREYAEIVDRLKAR